MIAKAYPYMARRLLTDPNESLRDALKELLFSNDQFRWGRLENLLREVNAPARPCSLLFILLLPSPCVRVVKQPGRIAVLPTALSVFWESELGRVRTVFASRCCVHVVQ